MDATLAAGADASEVAAMGLRAPKKWIPLAFAATVLAVSMAGHLRTQAAAARECPDGAPCPEETGPARPAAGIPVLLQYRYPTPSLAYESFLRQRKGRVRFHTTKSGTATLTIWSDDLPTPERLLEFQVAYKRGARGGFYFDGTIDPGSRVKLRARGEKDIAGVVNAAHFHEVGLVNLPKMGKWDAQFRLSGRVELMLPSVADSPTTTHFEPANAKVDFRLPLRHKLMLDLGAEAGTWITGLDSDFGVAPGARATVRLTF